MYSKQKNGLLFVVFIIIIILIISILIISVYNTKKKNVEQYKVSLNNVLYDEEYNFISLDADAVLKKEWDNNFYLYTKKNNKYSLGTETVIYDKNIRQINIYGTSYQVFINGDVDETSDKTTISNLADFQFFKLNDRKYLIIGDKITAPDINTFDYLIISIDKAGNASLLNHSTNIKTINPISIVVDNVVFDVANEKLISNEKEIDLKKINGSTNEYVQSEDKVPSSGNGSSNTNNGSNNTLGTNSSGENLNGGGFTGGNAGNSTIYKEIINQIITLSGMIPSNTNKTSLYKNVSLRDIRVGSTFLDIYYSIIDPENKYVQVFLAVEKVEESEYDSDSYLTNDVNCDYENVNCIFLDKDSTIYRYQGLIPDNEYRVSINYLETGTSTPDVADVVTVVTNSDPTSVRITQKHGTKYTYNVKLYNESVFDEAKVVITNCEDKSTEGVQLDITQALTATGATGIIDFKSDNGFVCLELKDVKKEGQDITVNSYHKIKVEILKSED